ncbi:hypothetical protein LTR09_000080 [Extremus antarcticus]|uniref:RRM domain-containing protein n=1 Tax=Extremus antarcticus TaxID=702011 RepID=A0AAJ0LX34_9PEZI|nr:hypothetical protein LTR09_000080 [Extremus antarcticus]
MDRIYVGNLAYVAQREDVEALFEANGISISKLDIPTDPFTGRNPSYCFVDLLPGDASLALDRLPGQEVRGRPIKVSSYTERRRKPARSNFDTYAGVSTCIDPTLSTQAHVFDRWHRRDAKEHWTTPCDEGRRLWIGGLPRIDSAPALNVELRKLFQGFGIEAVSKIIPTQPRDGMTFVPRYHYYCFVDVSTAANAKAAVAALDGKSSPHGGAYKIRISRPNHATKVVREQLGGVWPGEVRAHCHNYQLSPKRDLDGNWRRSAQGTSPIC